MRKSEKKKGKTKMWIAILVIVMVIGAGGVGGFLADAPGRREVGELTFSDVKFKNLHDGTFVGEYKGKKAHLRDAKVEIEVSEGEISNIKILKGALNKDGELTKLTDGHTIDELYDNAIKAGSLQVDAISGATLTSNAHLKALEDALKQAQ